MQWLATGGELSHNLDVLYSAFLLRLIGRKQLVGPEQHVGQRGCLIILAAMGRFIASFPQLLVHLSRHWHRQAAGCQPLLKSMDTLPS